MSYTLSQSDFQKLKDEHSDHNNHASCDYAAK